MGRRTIAQGCWWIALAAIVLYVGVGMAFQVGWSRAVEACRAMRAARGEFVEPGFSPVVTVLFNVPFWPVYAAANMYHDGTPFATPCTHQVLHALGGFS